MTENLCHSGQKESPASMGAGDYENGVCLLCVDIKGCYGIYEI